MPSQFFGLMIGYSGLTASQAAEHVTANNISNVNTTGYSKQVLTQEASEALRTYSTYGMAGAGVTAKSIDQLRDTYVDLKYWANQTSLGEYTVKKTYMSEFENYFTDSSTVPGFNTIYTTNFYNALSDLAKDPGSTTTRTAFTGDAQTLTEYFNSMSTDLEKMQTTVNSEVKDTVDQINSIASRIATLDQQINVIEIKGVTANELRDKRANLIDELSQLVDVQTTESDIYNASDPDNPTGAKRFTVTISGGCQLVNGYDYNTLECVSRTGNVNQSDIDGLYDIYWTSTGNKYSPMADSMSGKLKGLLELRDGNNKEYFHGTALSTATDTATSGTTITMQVSDSYLKDINKMTIPSSGTISISGVDYQYSGWSFDSSTSQYTFSNLSYTDNDGNKQTALVNAVKPGDTVKIGESIDYQGIPYYQSQMNEWVRSFSNAFNSIESTGYDLNGDSMAGISFFQMTDVSGTAHNFTDAASTVTSSDMTYNQLTAKNFTLNATIAADPAKMSTTANTESATNTDANDIVTALEDLKSDKTKISFRGCSSSEFLQCLLSDIALNAESANTFTTNYTNIQSALSNQRLSVSGVDDDEEALDLVKFQHAYELNSKVIQTMTEIYDRLILNTGV